MCFIFLQLFNTMYHCICDKVKPKHSITKFIVVQSLCMPCFCFLQFSPIYARLSCLHCPGHGLTPTVVHFISDVQNPDEITAAVFTKRNRSSSLTGLVMVELQDAVAGQQYPMTTSGQCYIMMWPTVKQLSCMMLGPNP